MPTRSNHAPRTLDVDLYRIEAAATQYFAITVAERDELRRCYAELINTLDSDTAHSTPECEPERIHLMSFVRIADQGLHWIALRKKHWGHSFGSEEQELARSIAAIAKGETIDRGEQAAILRIGNSDHRRKWLKKWLAERTEIPNERRSYRRTTHAQDTRQARLATRPGRRMLAPSPQRREPAGVDERAARVQRRGRTPHGYRRAG